MSLPLNPARREATSSPASAPLLTYDVTARKAHQWAMVALIALGFVVGGRLGSVPLAVAGAIMILGRFWWPADLVRQLVWRVLEPRRLLRRHEVAEDHETRRVARVLGGSVWLFAALFVTTPLDTVAWVLTGLVAVMVVLDATVDFCALCFVVAQLARRGGRFGGSSRGVAGSST